MTLDNLVVRYCDAIVREQEKWNKNKVSCETTENGIELDVDQYSIDEGRQLICMIKKRFIAEIFKYIVNSLYNELEREKPNGDEARQRQYDLQKPNKLTKKIGIRKKTFSHIRNKQ